MKKILHITSGDMAGNNLEKSGVPGEVFVWRDILYDGPRRPGWPGAEALHARALFLAKHTGGGLSDDLVLSTLMNQYAKLKSAASYDVIVLWFDACLFDQSMLCHILTLMLSLHVSAVELLCVDSFPGIEPYNGLGQLSPEQMASVYDRRRPVVEGLFSFAEQVDEAFALQDRSAFENLASMIDAPIPWIPAAVRRWLEEYPDVASGLGRLERMGLEAVRLGKATPNEIYSFVSANEIPPQFWGDTTLWGKINELAEKGLVRIEGPLPRLPQWEGIADYELFRVLPAG